jgi:hypothetical protein
MAGRIALFILPLSVALKATASMTHSPLSHVIAGNCAQPH